MPNLRITHSITRSISCSISCRGATAQRGGIITALLVIIVLVLFAGFFSLFFVFGKVVNPDQIGVRQNIFAIPGVGNRGYVSKGLNPGLHWAIPRISVVHTIPRTFQFISFDSTKKADVSETAQNPLRIPTADGSIVATDLTLIFRYFDSPGTIQKEQLDSEYKHIAKIAKDGVPLVQFATGKHSGPQQLVKAYGLHLSSQVKQIVERVDPQIKKSLSRLAATDFYNPQKREFETLRAQYEINKVLNPLGVEVWASLVRRYAFEKTEIDAQIFDKNLQEQTRRLNEALKRLAKEKAITSKVLAKLDADISVLKAGKTAEGETIRSKGDLYEAKKRAEGDLLVVKAEADVTSAKEKLFAQRRSNVYVGYEMVPLLKTLKGGVVTNIDPFDIDSWVQRLTGSPSSTSQDNSK